MRLLSTIGIYPQLPRLPSSIGATATSYTPTSVTSQAFNWSKLATGGKSHLPISDSRTSVDYDSYLVLHISKSRIINMVFLAHHRIFCLATEIFDTFAPFCMDFMNAIQGV